MNVYPALTSTFRCGDALARCLLVHVLGLTLAPLSFSEKTVKYTHGVYDVILFWNLIIALHGSKYRYGVDSLSAVFSLLIWCEMLPPQSTCTLCA